MMAEDYPKQSGANQVDSDYDSYQLLINDMRAAEPPSRLCLSVWPVYSQWTNMRPDLAAAAGPR
jgi:hypothetical protein